MYIPKSISQLTDPRATRHNYSTEKKIRMVLKGLRGEESIAELCRREGYELADVFVDAGISGKS